MIELQELELCSHVFTIRTSNYTSMCPKTSPGSRPTSRAALNQPPAKICSDPVREVLLSWQAEKSPVNGGVHGKIIDKMLEMRDVYICLCSITGQ